MSTARIGHYNVLFTNSRETIRKDVLEVAKRCSIADLNEGSDGPPADGIMDAVRALGWRFDKGPASDWLIYDPSVWVSGMISAHTKICKSAKEYGVDAKFNPERWLGERVMHFKKDNSRHAFFWTHLPAGYAAPAGKFPPRVARVKDLMAKEAIHNLDVLTDQFINSHPGIAFHHLQGDMNSPQRNDNEPWYPANVLDDNWLPDNQPQSIDWMMHSKRAGGHGMKVMHRENIRGPMFHSDHPFCLKVVSW